MEEFPHQGRFIWRQIRGGEEVGGDFGWRWKRLREYETPNIK